MKIATNIIFFLFLSFSIFNESKATSLEQSGDPNKLLIVGSRPWDENIENPRFEKIRQAHFLDACIRYPDAHTKCHK